MYHQFWCHLVISLEWMCKNLINEIERIGLLRNFMVVLVVCFTLQLLLQGKGKCVIYAGRLYYSWMDSLHIQGQKGKVYKKEFLEYFASQLKMEHWPFECIFNKDKTMYIMEKIEKKTFSFLFFNKPWKSFKNFYLIIICQLFIVIKIFSSWKIGLARLHCQIKNLLKNGEKNISINIYPWFLCILFDHTSSV